MTRSNITATVADNILTKIRSVNSNSSPGSSTAATRVRWMSMDIAMTTSIAMARDAKTTRSR